MAKLGRLKILMLFIFVMTILSVLTMIDYSVILSQQTKLKMKYAAKITSGHLYTRTLFSNDTARLALSHIKASNNLARRRVTEGFVANHQGQSNLDLNEPKGGWNDTSLCPENSSTLVGPLYVDKSVPNMEDIEKQMSNEFSGWVSKGGSWTPTECKARVKMALIIPFRHRYEQLSIFVRHMHLMLKRQHLDYRIFVVEQAGDAPFNRAMLLNIGFKEALKFDQFKCFIFHDVDLIPEDDRNEYSCPTSPRHMSVAVDKFHYRLPYKQIFGGAGSFSREHFELINGCSNIFWGWGGEDDNLYRRIKRKGLNLTRPSIETGRYKMLKNFHTAGKRPLINIRKKRMKQALTRMDYDGLNSLQYTLEKVTEHRLFTLVTTDLKEDL